MGGDGKRSFAEIRKNDRFFRISLQSRDILKNFDFYGKSNL